jgi:hypothetical protein
MHYVDLEYINYIRISFRSQCLKCKVHGVINKNAHTLSSCPIENGSVLS